MSVQKKPTCCLVIGMAGSGKTTLMQRINAHVHEKKIPSYILNLDPAVNEVPYNVNIDIRDTVNYKKVMKEYNLGPNGGILTSLNLFATRFDQVINIMEKKDIEYSFIDTPGQIEIFTWSASGQIISESLGSTFPTCILYVIDTPRNISPVTFMSNMLYACSIFYKLKLPIIIVLNKSDVLKPDFILKWMNDFELFQDAVQNETSYSSTLAGSMSLVLDEFYKNLTAVGVSAMTGSGIDKLFETINDAKKEYEKDYLPELEKKKKEREEFDKKKKEGDFERLKQDMKKKEDEKEVDDFLNTINKTDK
eukprot:gene3242-5685_t